MPPGVPGGSVQSKQTCTHPTLTATPPTSPRSTSSWATATADLCRVTHGSNDLGHIVGRWRLLALMSVTSSPASARWVSRLWRSLCRVRPPEAVSATSRPSLFAPSAPSRGLVRSQTRPRTAFWPRPQPARDGSPPAARSASTDTERTEHERRARAPARQDTPPPQANPQPRPRRPPSTHGTRRPDGSAPDGP
jgi:hypothetical protein